VQVAPALPALVPLGVRRPGCAALCPVPPPPPLLPPPLLLLPRPVLLRRRCREPAAAVAAAAAFRRGTWLALGMASDRMLLEPDIDLPERQKPSNPAAPPSIRRAVGEYEQNFVSGVRCNERTFRTVVPSNNRWRHDPDFFCALFATPRRASFSSAHRKAAIIPSSRALPFLALI